MRRWIPFAFFALLAVSGWEQANGGTEPPPFTCSANVAVPPVVRSEGITELVGDILLSCTGGKPTPAGQVIPTAAISVTLNTQVTNRLLNQSGQSDALLMIDEPLSATSPVPINLCTTPGGCPVISNGTGVGNFNGSSGHPNVFSGIVAGNQVTFFSVPVLPASSNGARVFRFTNVRANIAVLSPGGNQASVGQFTVPSIFASPSITFSNGATVPIINGTSPSDKNGPVVVAFPTQGPSFQTGYNPTTVTPSQTSFTLFYGASEAGTGLWKAISSSSTPTDPNAVSPTVTIPAPSCACESGTVINVKNPLTGTLIGAADYGTRFTAAFALPPGASASVPAQIPLTGVDNANVGTLLWSATPNTFPSGSNVTVTAGPTGSVQLYGVVAQASVTTSNKGFDLPITINGPFPQVPFNIPASLSYNYSEPYYQPLAFSSQSPGIPAFDGTNLDGSQPLNVDVVGSVVSSTTAPGDLSFLVGDDEGLADVTELSSGPNGGSSTGSLSQIALPPAMDISIISSGAPISGLTVTQDPPNSWLSVILNENTTPATASLSFDPTVAPGDYSTNLTFGAPNLSAPLIVPVKYTGSSGPFFTKWGFTNAASGVSNVVAPGMAFTISGYNFAPKTPATVSPTSGQAPDILGGTQVLFDGAPARLNAVFLAEANTTIKFEREAAQNTSSASVVVGFASYALAGKTTTQVQVVYNGVKSPPVTLNVLDAVPGVFTVNPNGTGQVMAINADNSTNSDSNRAPRGSIVTLLGTGFGLITPSGGDGTITGSPAPKINLDVKVYLDGALVQSSTRADAKNYDEIDAIKIRIPTTARPNADLPLMVQVGDKVSQPGVTIAVK